MPVGRLPGRQEFDSWTGWAHDGGMVSSRSDRGEGVVPVGPDSAGRHRARLTRSELRTLLLDAGRQILSEEGIETGSNNLTFKRVFDRVHQTTGLQLTNASVIRRVWENQADFQADVLVAVAQDEGRPEIDLTLQAVAAALDGVDLSSIESRRAAMSELCRVGGTASSDVIGDSPNWSLWISVMAIGTTSRADQRHRVGAALLDGYGSVTKFWEEVYEGLIGFLGFRPRSPWTVRDFTVATTALSEGYSLRQHVEGGLARCLRPTGPGGEDQEWTPFGIGLEALALQYFEPDPGFTPPA